MFLGFHMEELLIDNVTVKHQAAYDFLNSILVRKMPEHGVLKELYDGKIPEIEMTLDDFWKSDNLVLGNKLRTSHPDPKKIFLARLKVENDPVVRTLDYYVHQGIAPPRDKMRVIFGEFADDASKVYNYYNITGKKRKCGIPAATHPHNIAMTGYGLGFDKVGLISFVHHDVPEDLYNFLTVNLGLPQGLLGYDTFIKEVIPAPIRKYVNTLTNKYDTIIENISDTLDAKGLSFNQKNAVEELINMTSADYSSLEKEYGLGKHIFRTYSIADKLKDSKTFREDLKWACYINYINDMGDECVKENFYLGYDMKGLDLWFNGIGRDALNMDEMIKNALKQQTWVDKGYEMKSEFAPLEEHISEVGENVFTFTKNYIVKDVLKSIHQISHLGSALEKTRRLTPVLFDDVKTDYTIKKAA